MKSRHKVTFRDAHPDYPRLKIELRNKSRFYQACTFHEGRLRQFSTRTASLKSAFAVGGEWYRKLVSSKRPAHPRVASDASCAEVYAAYKNTLEAESRFYAEMKWRPIREFWGGIQIEDVSGTTFHDFIEWRRRRAKIKLHTIHKDIVLIRQVLRYAAERNVIAGLPTFPKLGKIKNNPRPWLNKDEFSRLLETSHKRIDEAKQNPRLHRQRKDCHDFMLFMYYSMMRVEEVRRLRFGDCRFDRNDHGEDILICDVDGKTEPREVTAQTHCYYMFIARQTDRIQEVGNDAISSELLFPHKTRDGFRELLKDAGLYKEKGNTRNLKSIRCTSIAANVLAGRSIFFIAKNAGTSVHMIDKFYAQRLTSSMAKDELTHFSREKNPEMFVKFFVESVPPIPMTKARLKNKSSVATNNRPPSSDENRAQDLPRLSPEIMREFLAGRQSTSSPTSKEISEFLAERATTNKKRTR